MGYSAGATVHGPSFLRWAGSKRKSLSLLSSAFRETARHYIEPFAGSAALFFETAPQTATLGDLNGQLINALRQVRDRPKAVYGLLQEIERTPENYYLVRNKFNDGPRMGLDSGVYFIYLNRNCFNGLWRTNLAGAFNVPFGGHEMGAYPPYDLFYYCSRLLKRARLKNQDFRTTIKTAEPNAFIYADPPYFSDKERVFVEYGKKSFDANDLNDLVDLLRQAEERGVEIALTYNAAMPIPNLPKHWRSHRFSVTRNVGGFTGSRKKQEEILYTNFDFEVCAK